MSTEPRGERKTGEKKSNRLIYFKAVKQDIGNLPLAMEYRNVFFFSPGHQSPPLYEGKSKFPDTGSALVGWPSGKNGPL